MINIWTDGSGTFRDGPACIGVLLEVDGAPARHLRLDHPIRQKRRTTSRWGD